MAIFNSYVKIPEGILLCCCCCCCCYPFWMRPNYGVGVCRSPFPTYSWPTAWCHPSNVQAVRKVVEGILRRILRLAIWCPCSLLFTMGAGAYGKLIVSSPVPKAEKSDSYQKFEIFDGIFFWMIPWIWTTIFSRSIVGQISPWRAATITTAVTGLDCSHEFEERILGHVVAHLTRPLFDEGRWRT